MDILIILLLLIFVGGPFAKAFLSWLNKKLDENKK